MAKTQDEIRELLSTGLFRKGVDKKYIAVSDGFVRDCILNKY